MRPLPFILPVNAVSGAYDAPVYIDRDFSMISLVTASLKIFSEKKTEKGMLL